MEEGEGLKGKIALHPLPLDAEQGRGRWAPAVALAGGPGHGGGRDRAGNEPSRAQLGSARYFCEPENQARLGSARWRLTSRLEPARATLNNVN